MKLATLMIITVVSVVMALETYKTTVKKLADFVYLEGLGTAFVAKGRLILETCIDQNTLTHDVELTTNLTKWFTRACDVTILPNCESMVQQLEEVTEKVHAIINTTILLRNDRIKKRSLMRTIFSFFSDTDQEIYDNLDDLNDVTDKLHKNQRIIIKQTKLLKNNVSTIEEQVQRMNQTLKKMSNLSFNESHDKKFAILMEFTMTMNFLTTLKQKYMDLLAPRIDHYAIQKIANLEGSIRVNRQFKSVVNWMETSVCSSVKHILYQTTEYQLLKTYQIAQKVNGTLKTMAMGKQYLAVADSELYFTMTTTEFGKCTRADNGVICEINALYNASTTPSCLLERMKHWTGVSTCVYKNLATNRTIVKNLESSNSWIFVAKNPTLVKFECPDKTSQVTVTESGIISTSPDCRVEIGNLLLMSRTTEHQKITGKFNVDPHLFTLTEPKNKTMESNEPEIMSDDENLEDIDYTQINHHHYHRYEGPTAIGGIALLTIVGMIIYKYKYAMPQTSPGPQLPQPPIPEPRSTTNPEPQPQPFSSKRWKSFHPTVSHNV